MDCCLTWDVGESHVIEDNPIMFGGAKSSKVVHVGDDERIVEAVYRPLGLASIGRPVQIDNSAVTVDGEHPMRIGVPVLEVIRSGDVVSKKLDVADGANFHSGDVNSFPEGLCFADPLNDIFTSLRSTFGLLE